MAYFAHGTESMAKEERPITEQQRLARMQHLANWLDSRWQIPGMQMHIGLDGILGLIPGIGDTLTAGLSAWIIYEAHQLGVPWWLKARMAWNTFIDWLFGLVPLVGDVFDIGWKANQKNMQLLMRHMEKQQSPGTYKRRKVKR